MILLLIVCLLDKRVTQAPSKWLALYSIYTYTYLILILFRNYFFVLINYNPFHLLDLLKNMAKLLLKDLFHHSLHGLASNYLLTQLIIFEN